MPQIRDMLGLRCGRLTVISFSHSDGEDVWWNCECSCGKKVVTSRRRLANTRKPPSCGCLRSEVASETHWRGAGELGLEKWSHIVRMARDRGIEVSLSIGDAWELYSAQGGRCALSGAPIIFTTRRSKEGRSACTASLDRIDSSIGYVPGNVQWLHKVVNIMKNVLSQEEFLLWCEMIVTKQRGLSHEGPLPSGAKLFQGGGDNRHFESPLAA
jgi:hypothetical protein